MKANRANRAKTSKTTTKETTGVRIQVNGTWQEFEVGPRTMLLELLREELHLTGTKNGCGQGHCGACTVIVDGEAVRSCVYKASRADGKTVETIEGLAKGGELHPLQRAFVEHGAVQCGFCTPGMIMASKALLDSNPDPTDEDIKKALKRNLCRCTGYAKIIEAVQAAAGKPTRVDDRKAADLRVVGHAIPRPDAFAQVTGETKYTADLYFEGMLHAKVLRSEYPHALVKRVDASRARQMPGVVVALTAADVPGRKNHGVVSQDWPVLAYDRVRYVGDALAVVAAQTEEQAGAALGAIEVEYEPLPVVTSPADGLRPDAPQIHEEGNLLKLTEVKRGDVEAAFARADVIIEDTFHTPTIDHAFLEPEASVAVPDPGSGGITVYVGSQIPFADREQIAASLDIPEEKVRVVHMYTGGAFGGKEDIAGQIHAALLAHVTGRPVKLVYTRAESLIAHPKRHATTITLKLGATRDGRVIAQKLLILGDTGAYASLGAPVMTRAATHSTGPYDVPNVDVECYAVHTNNPPAGAFRGFGALQAHFAIECQMDALAEKLGLSPFEVRRINALDVGRATSTGQILRESVGLPECIDRVEAAVREIRAKEERELPPNVRRGWGVASAYKNVGKGNASPDSAGASVEVTPDGKLVVRAGAAHIGQGLVVVLSQISAEVLGVSAADVKVILGDTGQTLDGGPTTASRQTFVTGNAARHAALQMRASLAQVAAEVLDAPPGKLVFADGHVKAPVGGKSVPLAEVAALSRKEGRPLKVDYVYTPPPTVALGDRGDSHFAYGFATQAVEVEVNTDTGEVRVLRVIAANDVGRAINPMALDGQVEGGVVMGIGHSLTERFVLEEGYVRTDSLGKYKIPDITWMPEITSIIVEHPSSEGPFGAKGAGEITSIPTPPAIVNAIYHAVGYRSHSIPIDLDAVRESCRKG